MYIENVRRNSIGFDSFSVDPVDPLELSIHLVLKKVVLRSYLLLADWRCFDYVLSSVEEENPTPSSGTVFTGPGDIGLKDPPLNEMNRTRARARPSLYLE